MPYVGNHKDKAVAYALERNLLLAGLSYAEIAKKTGERQRTISERNRLVHKISIWDAFTSRCEREGVPTRMPANRQFCDWFTGFFDGEGSITVFTRLCTGRPQYSEFRLGVRIQIREDDAPTIKYLHSNIGCGRVAEHAAQGTTRKSISWACEAIQDLREVIIPLFDTSALRTKKRQEYAIWRPLVVRRYIDTLGGRSNRKGVKPEYKATFENAIHRLRQIRGTA